MTASREQLKRDILAELDRVAEPHPMGSQDAYAARYVVRGASDRDMEIMFQKDAKSPPNLWCVASAVDADTIRDLTPKEAPSSKLYATVSSATGKQQYGRHSGLEKMPQLGQADLFCFKIDNLLALRRIIACLKAA